MIVMPRRSVTRFAIPLIDVLILLFCIFLLMSYTTGEEVEGQRETAAEQAETVETLRLELARRTKELQQFEALRPDLARVEQLKDEVDRLKNASRQALLERTYFRLLDIDPKTGELFYHDAGRPDAPRVAIPDAKAAAQVIERHRREARKRDLYYYFLYPRTESGYPTLAQERRYRTWFADVANSLQEARP